MWFLEMLAGLWEMIAGLWLLGVSVWIATTVISLIVYACVTLFSKKEDK